MSNVYIKVILTKWTHINKAVFICYFWTCYHSEYICLFSLQKFHKKWASIFHSFYKNPCKAFALQGFPAFCLVKQQYEFFCVFFLFFRLYTALSPHFSPQTCKTSWKSRPSGSFLQKTYCLRRSLLFAYPHCSYLLFPQYWLQSLSVQLEHFKASLDISQNLSG